MADEWPIEDCGELNDWAHGEWVNVGPVSIQYFGESGHSAALSIAKLVSQVNIMADLLLRGITHVSHKAPTRAEVEECLRKAGVI